MARGSEGETAGHLVSALGGRPVELFGEVWAGWGREQDAMGRFLAADIQLIPSGPDLPGMVIRRAHRHYIFVDDLLPASAPIIHRIVLAHEASHVMRGVQKTALCHTEPVPAAYEPREWQTWVDTGFLLIPRQYALLRLRGDDPQRILDRHADPHIIPEMIEWRALMEIAEGRWPGDAEQARAQADALLVAGLQAVRAATGQVHGSPLFDEGADDTVIRMARELLVRNPRYGPEAA